MRAAVIARGAAGLLILVSLGFSFADTFVEVSVGSGDVSTSAGTSAWSDVGVVGALFAILGVASLVTGLILGVLRKGHVARVLDAVTAVLLLAAIGTLIVFVAANQPDPFDSFDSVEVDYGLGWSGYVVLGLLGVATVLSVVAAAMPVPAEMTPEPPVYGGAPPAGGWASGPQFPAPPVENQKALWAMILGIVSFFCCAPVTSIIAIVLARQAKQEIVAWGGAQSGESKATAGLVLGIVSLTLAVLGIVFYVVIVGLALGDM